jgi:hypothetical protein
VKSNFKRNKERGLIMKSYKINNMIIDDGFAGEESVTADFTYNSNQYSITFNKADLETINAWIFEDEASVPANLSDEMVESIREDVKKRL